VWYRHCKLSGVSSNTQCNSMGRSPVLPFLTALAVSWRRGLEGAMHYVELDASVFQYSECEDTLQGCEKRLVTLQCLPRTAENIACE
jgi:hypothetical protein